MNTLQQLISMTDTTHLVVSNCHGGLASRIVTGTVRLMMRFDWPQSHSLPITHIFLTDWDIDCCLTLKKDVKKLMDFTYLSLN